MALAVVGAVANDFRSERTGQDREAADTSAVLSYKKLDVYRCAIELLALVAEVLESLSKGKGNAAIADQLKRAGLSVPQHR